MDEDEQLLIESQSRILFLLNCMGGKKMKKILVLLVALLLILSGCGNSQPATGGADQEKQIIKIGHGSAPGSARDLGAQKFKEIVEQETNGKYEVQIFPSNQLAGPREQIESVQLGNQEMVIQPSSWLGGFYPIISVLDIPFLFPSDKDKLIEVQQGEGIAKLLEGTEEIGIKTLGIWHTGYKQFTGPVALNTPEAFKGVKFRAMPSLILIEQFKALGAIPADIPWAETYNSLSNGTINGQENPIDTIYDMKFHEVQDVLTISDHGVLDQLVMVNKAWFDNLPEDAKAAVVKGVQEGGKVTVDKTYELINKDLELIKDSGTQVVEVTEDQRAQFSALTDQIKEIFVQEFGQEGADILEAIEADIAKTK